MPEIALLGDSPLFALFIAFLAIMAVAISKAGFGGALGALSAPIMLFAFPPTVALGVLIPVFILIDIWVVWQWRKIGVRRLIGWMVVFGISGQILGWVLLRFGAIDDGFILLMIGVIAVLTAARYFLGQWRASQTGQSLRHQARHMRQRIWQRAMIWCSLSGFTSFVSLTGGIPVQVYLLPLQLKRQLFVATMAWYFLFINVFKIPFFIDLGLVTPQSLSLSALLAVFVPLGVMVGRWMNKHLSDKLFYTVAYLCLLGLGMHLIYRFMIGDI